MNPPLRAAADREALLEGLADGTIDCIATDHAPHSAEEKARGLEKSAFGIVGLETAFPLLYTHLVRTGLLPLETLLARMAHTPRRLLEAWTGTKITGEFAWELDKRCVIDPAQFQSMGRATPFAGWEVYGRRAAEQNNNGEES
jgi:dihydroorotase